MKGVNKEMLGALTYPWMLKRTGCIVRLVLLILMCTLSAGCLPEASTSQIYIIEPEDFEGYPKWRMQGDLYLLISEGCPQSMPNVLKERGIQSGLLGGSLSYLIQGLPKYRSPIHNSNTFLLINITQADLSQLSNWPTVDKNSIPLGIKELEKYEPPFAFLKKDLGGRIRGLIVGYNANQIEIHLQALLEEAMPIGTAWTVVPIYKIVESKTINKSWVESTKELQKGKFKVVYPDGYRQDGETMMTWISESLNLLSQFIPEAMSLIDGFITVRLHTTDNLEPGWAHADISSSTIHFPIPSMAEEVDPYYSKTYHIGNIAHEFSHILFNRYRQLASGYGWESEAGGAPLWFTEGLGEYFRILVIGEKAFEENYRRRYDRELSNLRKHGLNQIRDVYAAGAWALRFMDDQFGLPVIIDILKSPEQTFWDAVKMETELGKDEFEQQFRNWLPRG